MKAIKNGSVAIKCTCLNEWLVNYFCVFRKCVRSEADLYFYIYFVDTL